MEGEGAYRTIEVSLGAFRTIKVSLPLSQSKHITAGPDLAHSAPSVPKLISKFPLCRHGGAIQVSTADGDAVLGNLSQMVRGRVRMLPDVLVDAVHAAGEAFLAIDDLDKLSLGTLEFVLGLSQQLLGSRA